MPVSAHYRLRQPLCLSRHHYRLRHHLCLSRHHHYRQLLVPVGYHYRLRHHLCLSRHHYCLQPLCLSWRHYRLRQPLCLSWHHDAIASLCACLGITIAFASFYAIRFASLLPIYYCHWLRIAISFASFCTICFTSLSLLLVTIAFASLNPVSASLSPSPASASEAESWLARYLCLFVFHKPAEVLKVHSPVFARPHCKIFLGFSLWPNKAAISSQVRTSSWFLSNIRKIFSKCLLCCSYICVDGTHLRSTAPFFRYCYWRRNNCRHHTRATIRSAHGTRKWGTPSDLCLANIMFLKPQQLPDTALPAAASATCANATNASSIVLRQHIAMPWLLLWMWNKPVYDKQTGSDKAFVSACRSQIKRGWFPLLLFIIITSNEEPRRGG